jgi:hypothetical protein
VNDLGTLNNRPLPLVAPDGEERPQADLTFDDLGDLQAAAVRGLPDPFLLAREQIATGGYSLAQEQFLLRTAMETAAARKPLELGSPEFRAFATSPAGMREMLWLSLRAADPSLSRDAAMRFLAKLDEAGVAQAASRITVREMFGGPRDPKAGGPTTPAARPA